MASQSVGPLRLADWLHSVPRRPHAAEPRAQRGLCQPSGKAAWIHHVGGGREGRGCLSSATLWRTPKKAIALQQDIHSFTYSLAHLFIHSLTPALIHSFMRFADSRGIFLHGLDLPLVLSGLWWLSFVKGTLLPQLAEDLGTCRKCRVEVTLGPNMVVFWLNLFYLAGQFLESGSCPLTSGRSSLSAFPARSQKVC